jgi:MFS family permease
VGFGMFGVVGGYAWFVIAMVVITVGEMIVAPVSQSVVVGFAPEDMRGRYNAVNGFVWIIPWAVGPLGAGLIMDNGDPHLVWLVAFAIGMVSTAGFLWLQRRAGTRFHERSNGHNGTVTAKEESVVVTE